METGFGRSPKHAHCRACAPRHDFGQRQKAMPPRVEGVPSSKGEYLPALADPGDTFWPGPGDCPRNQNAF